MLTLAISDVPGDDPAVIGSGPTVPDPTTLADARAIVARYQARNSRRRDASIGRSEQRIARSPNDPIFAATEFKLIARPADAFRAAEREARDARLRAGHARRPYRGRGPRNRRRACRSRARAPKGRPPRGDPVRRRTDGHHPRPGPGRPEPGIRPGAGDGAPGRARASRRWPATPTAPMAAAGSADDPAGAVDRRHHARPGRGRSASIRPIFSPTTTSTGFFSRLGDLVETGPTWTNVNDFRAIVVDRL